MSTRLQRLHRIEAGSPGTAARLQAVPQSVGLQALRLTAFFLQNTRGKQDISKQYIRLYYIFGFSFLYSYLKIRLLELYTVAYLGITYLDYLFTYLLAYFSKD